MGGRGGSSHRATGAAAGSYAAAQRMAASMGIRLDMASMQRGRINPIYVEETLRGVAAIYKAFPVMQGKVQYLDANETRERAYASAGGDGGLHMGLYGRMSPEELKRSWEYCVSTSFHPKGTSSASIFVHEMGHQIEVYLNKRDYGDPWAWGKTADAVVFEGIRNLDSSITKLHSSDAYALAKSISEYAVDNYNSRTQSWSTFETLAEAVSDYYENGSNANPLSREIWGILKRKMR